jgi:hypothetical protein
MSVLANGFKKLVGILSTFLITKASAKDTAEVVGHSAEGWLFFFPSNSEGFNAPAKS